MQNKENIELPVSLRDYLAAKAMQALVNIPYDAPNTAYEDRTAVWAYRFADAMLKAREVGA